MNLTQAEMQHMVDTMTPEEIKGWVQLQAFNAWKVSNCRGTIEAATGTGKTRVGIMAAHAELTVNPDALVYIAVPTETLRDDDWPDEMKLCGFEYLVKKTRRVCWSSLSKERPKKDVDLFIGDEIHRITPANSVFFQKDYKVFKILGLTATLPDPSVNEGDADKATIINALAPSVYQVNLEEAIALKLVSDFEISVLKFDLDDSDFYIKAGTDKKSFMTTEKLHYKYLSKQLGKAMYSKNDAFKFSCMQKRVEFINNLKSKELFAKEIMGILLKDGDRTLIFCGSIEQSGKLCGQQVYNSQTSNEQLVLFCEEKINYLGVVQALNEGKNVPKIDQGLIVQLNSRELAAIQRIGRHIRYRKGHVARIVVLIAKGTVDEKWCDSAFRNFNKSRIKQYNVIPEYRTAKGNVPAASS